MAQQLTNQIGEALVEVLDPNSGKFCKVIIALKTGQPSRYPSWTAAIRAYFGRTPYPSAEQEEDKEEDAEEENRIKVPRVVPTLGQLGSESFFSSYSNSIPSVNGSPPLAPAAESTTKTYADTNTNQDPSALCRITSISCINELPSRMSDFDLFHFAKDVDKKQKDSEWDSHEDCDDDDDDDESDEDSGPTALFRPMKSKTRNPLEDRHTQDIAEPLTPKHNNDKGKGKGKAGVDQKGKGKENKENDNDTPRPSPSKARQYLDWFTSYELVIRTKSEKKYNL